MKLRNQLLLLLAFCLSCGYLHAQDKEIGIFLGTTEYQGDLTKKQVTLKNTQPGFGILGRYYFGPRIDIQGNLNYGMIKGSDVDYAATDKDRKVRNLSFKSNILELGAHIEFNILPFISNSKRYRFAPYVFAGLAGYHFNPKAEYKGTTYALRPLGTEGQNIPGATNKYSLWQLAIPYGIGIKYSLGNFWNIGIEFGQRKLFTDYLDDVSQKYANPQDIAAHAPSGMAEIAPALADRSGEILGKPLNQTGIARGLDKNLDMYVFTGITITKTIRRFSCTGF